jgi:hypothetical protein
MNETTQTPPSNENWTANRKVWFAFAAILIGLALVIAPFPWNRWREVHPKEAREGIEFRVAELVAEGLRKYRETSERGALPVRLRDLDRAGLLPSPDPAAHPLINSYSEHFFYYPNGVPTPNRGGDLIVINATSLTVKGVSGHGRYGIWLDSEDQVVGPSWIPEAEAQEYLKEIEGRQRQ